MIDDDVTPPQAAFREGPNAHGPDDSQPNALAFSMPSAANYMSPDTVSLGRLAPDYEAKRDARLDQLAQRESGGRNVSNPDSSASGYFQMTNPTWQAGTKLAGGDAPKYPAAKKAPYPVQKRVAGAIYDQVGEKPWAVTVKSSPVIYATESVDDFTGKKR